MASPGKPWYGTSGSGVAGPVVVSLGKELVSVGNHAHQLNKKVGE